MHKKFLCLNKHKLIVGFVFLTIPTLFTNAALPQVNSQAIEQSCQSCRQMRRVTIQTLSEPSLNPLAETATTSEPSSQMNVIDGKFITVRGRDTIVHPKTDYYNAIDLTPNYTFLKIDPEVGWNNSPSTNIGRTGIYANRVKIVHEGQGDATAYNASVRVRGKPNFGTANWIASPAGVILNGTISGENDGVYLNPFEIHMTDTPADNSYNVAAYGIVINGNRNKSSGPNDRFGGNSIGQVWGGARFQSEGKQPWDNIISAQGKFLVGIDLSMSSADFGQEKAAIALKSKDRIYFDCTASSIENSVEFVRKDKRATSCQSYIRFNDVNNSLEFYVLGKLALSISDNGVSAAPQKSSSGSEIDISYNYIYDYALGSKTTFIKNLKSRRKNDNNADGIVPSDEGLSNITLKELAERVKALEKVVSDNASSKRP